MKKLYIKKLKPEQIESIPINADEYPDAIHVFLNEQREDRRRYNTEIKNSTERLDEICNEFDRLISTTDDLAELLQAIIDVKTMIRFYEDFKEPCLAKGINDLKFIAEKGEEKKDLLNLKSPAQQIRRPKLESKITDDKLVEIFSVLVKKKKIQKATQDQWLYWFGRKPTLNHVGKIEWIGSRQSLSDVMGQVCGEKKDRRSIFDAFKHSEIKKEADIPKAQTKDHQNSTVYKAINQLI